MKKVIKFIKSNILGFLVGISLCLDGVIIAENMLSSEQVSYSGTKTEQTTVKGTLDELFSAVDINERLGSTDISSIGDGTITGAVSTLNTNLGAFKNEISSDLTGFKWKGDLPNTWSACHVIYGWGIIIEITSMTIPTNISGKIFTTEGWHDLNYGGYETKFYSHRLVFEVPQNLLDSGIIEYSKSYLCSVTFTLE